MSESCKYQSVGTDRNGCELGFYSGVPTQKQCDTCLKNGGAVVELRIIRKRLKFEGPEEDLVERLKSLATAQAKPIPKAQPISSPAASPQPRRDQSWWMKFAAKTFGPGLWKRLHEWPATADLSQVNQWLDRFANHLPCGTCRQHFRDLIKAIPPNTANRLCLAFSTWEWHNKVNREKESPSPQMIWEEAAKLYGWNELNSDPQP
jgi:hypothetical protein